MYNVEISLWHGIRGCAHTDKSQQPSLHLFYYMYSSQPTTVYLHSNGVKLLEMRYIVTECVNRNRLSLNLTHGEKLSLRLATIVSLDYSACSMEAHYIPIPVSGWVGGL